MDYRSLENTQQPIMTQINIFTDGSKTDAHCGAGYVIYDKNETLVEASIKLSYNATVFQAEIMAIREAAKAFISVRTETQLYIKILTDSQAAFQALAARTYTSKLVKETMEELNKLGKIVNRLEISWIKAHVGYKGNERADTLARSAEEKAKIDLHISDSWTSFKTLVWDAVFKEWTIRWSEDPTCRLTKIFYPIPNPTMQTKIFKLSRSAMTNWV